MDTTSARQLLVKMLVELRDSPFFEANAADLEGHRMPLFELILRRFLEAVTTIVRKGIARTYVETQDNLVFIRGKLHHAENIRRNCYSAARVFCAYDEFEADRPVNRLIKGALEIVARVSTHGGNQQRCRELLFWFRQVPTTRDVALDFRQMRQDRNVRHYAPAMKLCRLILNQLNPLTTQGDHRVVSMLFPMERVFESYVAAKLPSQLPGWKISTQRGGRALVDIHRDRPMFKLFPDLTLTRGQTRVVADTKWKLIDERDQKGSYGISQPDVYQLFAYGQKFLSDQPSREVILIYPACDTFSAPLDPFWYRDGSDLLLVAPYDLNLDRLSLPPTSQIQVTPALATDVRATR